MKNKRITQKEINDYFDKTGSVDPTNQILLDELEYNETLGAMIKKEIKDKKLFTDKGRLSQAFIGYKMYLANKIALCTKLTLTVQERKKLKLTDAPDATQMQIEEFMKAV